MTETNDFAKELWDISRGVFAALVDSDITFSFTGLKKVLDAHEADLRHRIGEELRTSNETASLLAQVAARDGSWSDEYAEGYIEGREHARLIILNTEDHAAEMATKEDGNV